MFRMSLLFIVFTLFPLHTFASEAISKETISTNITAKEIIRQAMNHWRGVSSYSKMSMTIHRPDWQRVMTMEAWTQGDKHSLVRVIEPKKDAGNATLLKDNNMWTFSPKINRVIKIPSSMMNQSWMGSDFSNKDISKSIEILEQYEHQLKQVFKRDGYTVYVIIAIPNEDAAVVWGKEILYVRDDFVLLEEQFWDQDGKLIKTMKAMEVAELGGRMLATRLRMNNLEKPDEWTEMATKHAEFDVALNAHVFTLSNLRNPR